MVGFTRVPSRALNAVQIQRGCGVTFQPIVSHQQALPQYVQKYPAGQRQIDDAFFIRSLYISSDKIFRNLQRHHASERTLQRAFHEAVRKAGINKPVHPHTLRHSPLFLRSSTFLGRRLRHSHDSRIARPCRSKPHDDLHARG